MKIKLQGPISDRTGYGTASIEYARGLRDLGHEVFLYPQGPVSGVDDLAGRFIPVDDPDITISHLIPHSRKYDVLITVAEFKPVPYTWKYGLDNSRVLVTKSKHSKECLESMTSAEIHVVPDGVREDFGTSPLKPIFDDDTFRFLSVFEWVPRKQGELLLRSFCEEFTPDDDVELWVKSSTGDTNPLVEIPKILKDYPVMREKVRYIKSYFKDISVLYRSFDGFVLPVAMEGFGRTFMEAIACGIKPVAPGAGGNMEFTDDWNSYLVRCGDWKRADHGKVSLRWNPTHIFHPDAMWRVPLKKDLKEKMRVAFEKKEKLHPSYVESFKQRWSWTKAVEKLSKIM